MASKAQGEAGGDENGAMLPITGSVLSNKSAIALEHNLGHCQQFANHCTGLPWGHATPIQGAPKDLRDTLVMQRFVCLVCIFSKGEEVLNRAVHPAAVQNRCQRKPSKPKLTAVRDASVIA